MRAARRTSAHAEGGGSEKTTPAGRIDASTARSALAAAEPAWRRERAAKMPESTVPAVVISVTRTWVQFIDFSSISRAFAPRGFRIASGP